MGPQWGPALPQVTQTYLYVIVKSPHIAVEGGGEPIHCPYRVEYIELRGIIGNGGYLVGVGGPSTTGTLRLVISV